MEDAFDNYEVTNYDQLFFKNETDTTEPELRFTLTRDLDVNRSDAEALAPFNHTKDMMLLLDGNTMNIRQDIKGFVDTAKAHSISIQGANGSIIWPQNYKKAEPFIVANEVEITTATISGFKMDDVFVDANKINMNYSTITRNEYITFKTREGGSDFSHNTFTNNSANQGAAIGIGNPNYPLIYIATSSNPGTIFIQNNTFTDNTFIYSYIMTDFAENEHDMMAMINGNTFNLDSATNTRTKQGVATVGADLSAVIKTRRTDDVNTSATGRYDVSNNTFRTNTNTFGSIIDAYETNLSINNETFTGLTLQQAIVRQEQKVGSTKEVELNISDTTFRDNTIQDYNTSNIIFVKKNQHDAGGAKLTTFNNVTIDENRALFAFFAADVNMTTSGTNLESFATNSEMMIIGKNIIKNTKHQQKKKGTGDIYLPAFADTTANRGLITFADLTKDSEIWFYRPTITDTELVVSRSWQGGMANATDDALGATERNIHIYDKDRGTFTVYKDDYSLRVAKYVTNNAPYTTITFDLNRGKSTDPDYVQINNSSAINDLSLTQYIKDGSFIDMPATPSASNFDFGGWYVRAIDNENKWEEYEFNTAADDWRLYKATSSVIYAKWLQPGTNVGKLINLTIWGNRGGRADDGTIYGETDPSYVVYKVPMGGNVADTTGGSNGSYEKFDETGASSGTGSGSLTFTRAGQVEYDWWMENGWNNGRKNGEWGTKWVKNESEWLIDKDVSSTAFTNSEGNLYVRWRGDEYHITYDLNDQEANSTTRATHSIIGKATISYYNERIAEEYPLPIPEREGYTFAGWYSDAALTTEVIENVTYYNWTTDMTFHAKWTPIRYNVIYAIDPQYPADKTSGTMRNSQFTFDKVDDRLTANAYRVSGNDFIWWEGIDANGNIATYSNSEVGQFNFATTSNANYTLTAKFDKNVRRVSFDLNDNIGHNDATVSYTSKIATYGNTIGELPVPTRKGYTFNGWWVSSKKANTIGGADEMYRITKDTVFDETLPKIQTNNEFIPYTGSAPVYTMSDFSIFARWESNLYTVKTENGVKATDELQPEGDDVEFDTAYDFSTNFIDNSLKSNLVFPSRQYHDRKGYDYLGLYGEVNGNVKHIDNTGNANVTINSTSPLYNFGEEDIASGSEIVLKASWSEWKYDLTIDSGLTKVRTIDPAVVLDPSGNTTATYGPFNRDFTATDSIISLIGNREFKINGWNFQGFVDNTGKSYSYDDIISGATFSNIRANNGAVTLTGEWRQNYYIVHFKKSTDANIAAEITGQIASDINHPENVDFNQEINVGATTQLFNILSRGRNVLEPFSYTGHSFKEWQMEGSNATFSNAEAVYNLRTNQGDIATLSAVWQPFKYSIPFALGRSFIGTAKKTTYPTDVTGDVNTMRQNNITYDTKLEVPVPAVERHGFDVVEYNSKNDGTGVRVTPSTATNKNYIDGKFLYENGLLKSEDNATTRTLYVIFKANTYNVGLDMNDTEGSTRAVAPVTTISVVYQQKITDAYNDIMTGTKAPTRAGYVLKGWAKDPAGTTRVIKNELFESANLTGDVVATYYAIWEPYSKWKLKVHANEIDGQRGNVGTENSNKQSQDILVEYDGKIGTYANVPREIPTSYIGGYKMVDYATASNPAAGYTPITKDSVYNWELGDTTIYAQYEPINYKVAYSTGSYIDIVGTMATQSFTYGVEQKLSTVSAVEGFRRAGYSFDKWSFTNRKDAAAYLNRNTRADVKDTYANAATVSRLTEDENDVV
ncbi:MAG: InlB B-repeat-containing protein, partial [Lachnospiraceae bacterium]|nr:InlB B-repeat-containing protein [Lachnospiraceae bacterium]